MNEILFYSFVFGLSFGSTWLMRRIALRKAILDIPNQRSSHARPTPRGGGVAIVLAWYAGLSFLFFTGKLSETLFGAFLPGLLLVGIGFLDDIFQLKPIFRLSVQVLAAGASLAVLGGLQKLDFGFWLFESPYLLTILAFFGFLWSINLYNFLDGIDGYAASEIIFLGIALFLFTFQAAALLLAVAALGFLPWNWQEAKIFMGDVGSTLLGFNVAVLAVYFQNTEEFSIFGLLILYAVFWFDASLTLFRRWRRNEKLTQAHRKHAYQRLVRSGWSHQKTVLAALALNLAGFGLAMCSMVFKPWLILFFVLHLTLIQGVIFWVDKRKAFD